MGPHKLRARLYHYSRYRDIPFSSRQVHSVRRHGSLTSERSIKSSHAETGIVCDEVLGDGTGAYCPVPDRDQNVKGIKRCREGSPSPLSQTAEMQGSETEDELLPSPEQNDDDFAGEDVEDTASDEEVEDDTLQTSEMRKVLRELQEDVFEQSYAPENLETSDAREPGGEDVEMHPPPRPAFTDLHDPFEEIPHHFSPVMDDLSLMLGLWCIESGVTNSSYSALLHILDEVNDVAQLRKLPRSLSTLKSNTKRQFPLLKMRRKGYLCRKTNWPLILRNRIAAWV